MKRSIHRSTLVAQGLLAAVLGCLLWLSFQRPVGLRRPLPGGGVLELQAITIGRQHHFVDGNFWKRTGISSKLNEWLHRPGTGMGTPIFPDFSRCSTPTLEPVLWLKLHDLPPEPGAGSFRDNWAASVLDSDGCRLRPSSRAKDTYRPVEVIRFAMDTPHVEVDQGPVPLDVYPRRDGRATFAVLQRANPNPVLRFPLTGLPVVGIPGWQPKPLPQTVRCGDTDFTLATLKEVSAARSIVSSIRARFSEHRGTSPSDGWQVRGISVSDATGNRLDTTNGYQGSGEFVFARLCRREPAWKLLVEFVRPIWSDVPPDCVLAAHAVRIPGTGEFIPLTGQVSFGNTTVQLAGISGPGLVTFTSPFGMQSSNSPTPSVWFGIRGEDGFDISDREGTFEHPRIGGEAFPHLLSFSIGKHPDAGPVDVRLAIRRSRLAEYLVKPP